MANIPLKINLVKQKAIKTLQVSQTNRHNNLTLLNTLLSECFRVRISYNQIRALIIALMGQTLNPSSMYLGSYFSLEYFNALIYKMIVINS